MLADDRPAHLVFFSDCPYYGGAEEYVAMLARARPRDWKISGIVSEGDAGEMLAQRLAAVGATVRRCAMRPFTSPALWRDVFKILRELRGDVLHINLPSGYDGRLSTPAPLAKLAGYRRVVTTEHLPMIGRARRRMGVKMLCSAAIDAIIVHTEWNRQYLAHHHHLPLRKITIIPNGSPDVPPLSDVTRENLRRTLGVAPGDVALAIVGRLTARKGHRFLFDALADLAAQGQRGWKLLVVGEGEQDEQLRGFAVACGLESEINFLGLRDNAREVIQASDVLVVPSLLESQPLVITEAMASGVPVVASSIYGIPEIVTDGETGLLVPPGDSEPLGRALARLLGDADLRNRMGRTARQSYERNFTQEIMAQRTYQVLRGEKCACCGAGSAVDARAPERAPGRARAQTRERAR